MHSPKHSQSGFTLLELMLTLVIAAVLLTSLIGVVDSVFNVQDDTRDRNSATREARFAMQRIVIAVRQSDRLLLPLADNPNTNWRENVREQSIPPEPPEGSSTFATAVLAVTMGPLLDRDEDGWADANNDKDFLDLNNNATRDAGEPERVDEDLDADNSNDSAAGIAGIDDDADGAADEGGAAGFDDDEDGADNEDNLGNGDEDGDGHEDEDQTFDMNGDGQPGLGGVDDDFDGNVDEGNTHDDDEDGLWGEDWFDPVVFFLSGGTLTERLPNLNPVDGSDYTEYPIADNVTHFRVERIPDAGKRSLLVDITLELTPPDGEPTSLSTRVRVGGSL